MEIFLTILLLGPVWWIAGLFGFILKYSLRDPTSKALTKEERMLIWWYIHFGVFTIIYVLFELIMDYVETGEIGG
jgi:hypothetical protein